MKYSFIEISHFVGQIASPLFCFSVLVHAIQPVNENMQFHFFLCYSSNKDKFGQTWSENLLFKYRYASLHSSGLMVSKSGMIL